MIREVSIRLREVQGMFIAKTYNVILGKTNYLMVLVKILLDGTQKK